MVLRDCNPRCQTARSNADVSRLRPEDRPEDLFIGYPVATHPLTQPIFRTTPARSVHRMWWQARDRSGVPMCWAKTAKCNGPSACRQRNVRSSRMDD